MDQEDVRLAIYHGFAEDGRAPSVERLVDDLGATEAEVLAALADLHAERHVVLDATGRHVVMAHPFASIPLGFSVMGARTLWWGGCAWDAFALPHLLPDEHEVLVATTCPACARAHAWLLTDAAPPEGDQVAHFLVPVTHMWDDVVHTCGHQRLFCDERCVTAWLDRSGHDRGDVIDLSTLWRLAARWYEGRLERGYVRREPVAAKAYLAEVGLRGAFWGL